MVYVSAIELLYFLRLNMLDDDVEKVFHFTSSNFYLTFKFSHNEMSAIDNKTNSKVIQEKWLYMQEFVSATAKLLKENPLPTNDPVFNDLTESINDAIGFIQKYQ